MLINSYNVSLDQVLLTISNKKTSITVQIYQAAVPSGRSLKTKERDLLLVIARGPVLLVRVK